MKYIGIFLLFLFFINCNNADAPIIDGLASKIVVDGAIEEGEVPEVTLSRSIPVNVNIDETTVLNYVIRSAKVTVSDGVNTEVLKLKKQDGKIPPFVYYGSSIIGEAGKTYSLKIEYLDRIIEAKTVIPKTVNIKSAEFKKQDPTDRGGYVYINFVDPILEKNYYQVATKLVDIEPVFVPAFYGNLDDAKFNNSSVAVQINRGILVFSKEKYKPFFLDGDVIQVKLRTMNKESFDFWNDWQNEIVNSTNPIYPSNKSLKTNIKGGVGIWAGYGKSMVTVIASKKNEVIAKL
jgi:Domain of unknown function (DUF4249)